MHNSVYVHELSFIFLQSFARNTLTFIRFVRFSHIRRIFLIVLFYENIIANMEENDHMDRIIVRVKYSDDIRFIALPVNDVKPSTFALRGNIILFCFNILRNNLPKHIFLVARAFKLVLKEGDKAKFFDNHDCPIPEGIFSNVIKTYYRSGSFYVNVSFKTDNGTVPTIITPFVRK